MEIWEIDLKFVRALEKVQGRTLSDREINWLHLQSSIAKVRCGKAAVVFTVLDELEEKISAAEGRKNVHLSKVEGCRLKGDLKGMKNAERGAERMGDRLRSLKLERNRWESEFGSLWKNGRLCKR